MNRIYDGQHRIINDPWKKLSDTARSLGVSLKELKEKKLYRCNEQNQPQTWGDYLRLKFGITEQEANVLIVNNSEITSNLTDETSEITEIIEKVINFIKNKN